MQSVTCLFGYSALLPQESLPGRVKAIGWLLDDPCNKGWRGIACGLYKAVASEAGPVLACVLDYDVAGLSASLADASNFFHIRCSPMRIIPLTRILVKGYAHGK